MPVFMFICKEEDGTWNAKQYKKEGDADLTAEAGSTYELGRKLVSLACESAGPGGVTSFFSYTSPNAGVFEVNVGGGGGGGGFSAGGGGGGAAAPAAVEEAAPAVEEKKEEKEEEEEDDDMGFSLFD
eukprot:TRINITY_DN32600_c0_g1_i1.p1 TRINITY_DN32600_c0_g1~~TRINITY_DN32600_c0_g1_i1.p1  ORF type:complete len:127 (+),score=58.34 TRINITY_DN32600_c0_g1_i1:104-484(+)